MSSKSFYKVIYFPRNTSFRSRTKEGVHLPGMQTQRKVPGSSRQEPSFWQGWDSHSFTFVSHLGPVNPCVQLQANEPGVFTQIPSCSQGDPGTNKISFFFSNNRREQIECDSDNQSPFPYHLTRLKYLYSTN